MTTNLGTCRTSHLASWQLRAEFARRMADTYGREVPAYPTLVHVSEQVNADVVERDGATAQRMGSIDRVTAERHGAIRVGTPVEMKQVSRIFAALGMQAVGFYDLRDAAEAAVPVVSTAFRPIDPVELDRNPFRMFTSMLVTDDRRFFSGDLQARLDRFLARRTLFPPELLALAERAVADQGLAALDAERFLFLAVQAFTLSSEPVDRSWYRELEQVSPVAADIGGVTSTHINHLTPRVLDIDDLYQRMTGLGITMIDTIQGPPRWSGPDVLLRQTSFRALAEPRQMREADGTLVTGSLSVRFGEVEARGAALTPAGRDRYDSMLREVDRVLANTSAVSRQDVAEKVWTEHLPSTERKLHDEGLAYFTYAVTGAPADRVPGRNLAHHLNSGVVVATPIVYEDFLPRSAAGIFQSNLGDTAGAKATAVEPEVVRDVDWLSDVVGVQIRDPFGLYAAQQRTSQDEVAEALDRR